MLDISYLSRWPTALAIILIGALLITINGLTTIPIEAHEAFVLIAAQHMRDTGDWVIPFFNGAPHLTKPPMSYWLTMFVSWLGDQSLVYPWHGRLPSALAGTALVLVTAISGKKLFDQKIGILAAVIAMTSTGVFYYSHSARPEMLYAFWCSLAVLIYLHLLESPEKGFLPYLLWACFGAAILTKGPQLPAMLLLAFAIDQYWRGNNLRQACQILSPLTGLLLMIAIALPWWWLLHHRLGGMGLNGTQLSGTLLRANMFESISLYYLYRPLQLLGPWIIFLPCILVLKKSRINQNNLKLLGLLVLLPALILTFGPQKRWYYFLPAMMPMCIILAAAIITWCDHYRLGKRATMGLKAFAVACVLIFIAAGASERTWGSSRFSQAKLAGILNQQALLLSDPHIVTWGITPEIYSYYSGKIIDRVNSPEEVSSKIAQAPRGQLLMLLQSKYLSKLPTKLQIQELGEATGDSDDGPAKLILLSQMPNNG